MTEASPLSPARTAELAAELADFTRIRAWSQELMALQLCGPDGGESDLLGYHEHPTATLDLSGAHPSGLAMLLAGRRIRLSDLVREHAALADARRRARAVRAVSERLRRVHGVSAGHLAVGMAGWGEEADRRTLAPVLLRVARLRPRGHGEDDYDIDLAPATRLNPVLVEHLRVEYGVPLDAGLLAELAAGPDGFDPLPTLRRLAETCADIPGFTVEPSLVIGVFPEVVPALVSDFEARGVALLHRPVVAALLGPGLGAGADQSVADEAAATSGPEPLAVLDLDDEQLAVVADAVAGRSVLMKAAPGSGTTQALAAAVAALAGGGKRSLLLSSYADELAAVRARLSDVGLGRLVLDLGADPHDGAHIAAQLLAAVDGLVEPEASESADEQADQPASDPAAVAQVRARALDEHLTSMHAVHEPWGVSAYQAQVALAELTALRPAPRSRVRLAGSVLDAVPRTRLAELRGAVGAAARAGAFRVGPEADPWYGARITSAEEAGSAIGHARALADGGLDAARVALDEAFDDAGLPRPKTVAGYTEGLALLAQIRETVEIFRPEAWDTSVGEAVSATATKQWREEHGATLSPLTRRRIRGRVRSLLRPGLPPADLHGALVRLHEQRAAWERYVGRGARPQVPATYDEAVDAHRDIVTRLDWLALRLRSTPAGPDLTSAPLDDLQVRLAAMAERTESLARRPEVVEQLDHLVDAGLKDLVEDLAARRVEPGLAGPELDLVWWSSVLGRISNSDPLYATHDGDALRAAAAEFTDADRLMHAQAAKALQRSVAHRIGQAAERHPDQVASLRAWAGISSGEHGGALVARPRVAVPVARVLSRCRDLVTAIAPCWSLSPLLAASVLPPEMTFDVALVGQAHSLSIAQSINAVGRADSVVVSGDSRLERSLAAGDPLTAAAARALPAVALRSSYRPVSDDLALLAEVITGEHERGLPLHHSPPAVIFDRVEGVGVLAPEASAVESTEAEVSHLVAAILAHAGDQPGQSLAVVTLNRLHADHLREALRLERALPAPVAQFLDPGRADPLIVVDVLDCAGLVRDVVIFAVGYGRTPHGRVLHQFGTVSGPDGPAALLTAVTRARERLRVVAAFGAEDLEVERLKSPGPRALRALLATVAGQGGPSRAGAFSGAGGVGGAGATALVGEVGALDALLEDFAARLESDGLVVERAVVLGPATDLAEPAGPEERETIDLVVRDAAGRGPWVAIDSDGPAYAARGSVRERDRLHPERVARMGLQHLRVWSTDVFRDPAREVARVHAALDAGRPREEEPATPSSAPDSDARPGPERAPEPEPAAEAVLSPEPARVEQTRDDTDVGWGEVPETGDEHDRWLNEQRPPHWE